MRAWTKEAVAQRFEEAVDTARRLPPIGPRGYATARWPMIRRMPWEAYAANDEPFYFPPTPAAVDRMMETHGWLRWLTVPERHLVWQRAEHKSWRALCRHLHCDRTTAWRRWQRALDQLVHRLNV